MWEVRGKQIDTDPFKPFEPSEVLLAYDGPRSFTFIGKEDELFLAHWCDEDESCARYIVVPFTKDLVRKLTAGEMSTWDALQQPRTWIVDVKHMGQISQGWRVELADLPKDLLPDHGTMLLAEFERHKGSWSDCAREVD